MGPDQFEQSIRKAAKEKGCGIGIVAITISLRTGRILLGERASETGKGKLCPPGGKLDLGESFVECGVREWGEETGFSDFVVMLPLQTAIQSDLSKYRPGLRFITNYIIVLVEGEPDANPPVVPNEFESWGWYDMDDLPKELFGPFSDLLQSEFDLQGAIGEAIAGLES